jgi:hypothetical protein
MFVNVVCDKCGSVIYKMKVLRPIKEILNQSSNRCTGCGALLNPADLAVKATKIN